MCFAGAVSTIDVARITCRILAALERIAIAGILADESVTFRSSRHASSAIGGAFGGWVDTAAKIVRVAILAVGYLVAARILDAAIVSTYASTVNALIRLSGRNDAAL